MKWTPAEMKQAWCVEACGGGAKVAEDAPLEWLHCLFCGAPLTFEEPKASQHKGEGEP